MIAYFKRSGSPTDGSTNRREAFLETNVIVLEPLVEREVRIIIE